MLAKFFGGFDPAPAVVAPAPRKPVPALELA